MCAVQKVIQTNWKIDGAHIHRQWGKATQLNYRVKKSFSKAGTLGRHLLMHTGKSPTRVPSVKKSLVEM